MTSATPVLAEDDARTATGVPTPIAYIVSRFPRLTETFILREILELERRGQPVMVFPLLSIQQSIRHSETGTLTDRVYYTPYLSREVFAANLYYLVRSPFKYLKALFHVVWGNRNSLYLWIRGLALFPKSVRIAHLINTCGAQHVHAHFATHPTLAAMVISELTGIGYSFTVHAHDIFVHTAGLREKIDRARFVAAISEYNKRHLLRLIPEVQETKIHVVRCGVDSGQYAQHLPRRRIKKQQLLYILCVASLEPYKGIEHLIRACDQLRRSVPGFRCEIIGDGRERGRLSALIGKLKLEQQVCLIGPRKQDEVAEKLRQADLFVLPSVVARDGQMEGIPVALMEAMASGLPVVASHLSGIPELVEHGVNGLLVPPGDEIALSQALALLYLREDLREQFGLRGREKVAEAFHLRENVAKLASLFHASVPLDSHCSQKSKSLPFELEEKIQQILVHGTAERRVGDMSLTLQPLHPDSNGHDSAVYAVQVEGIRQEFILKRHQPRRDHGRAEQCARCEYETLKHLAKELPRSSSRFRVPEVLSFFPESNAVLMAKCPGENFERQLRWAQLRYGLGETTTIFGGAAACGEWLGAFHTATRQQKEDHTEIQQEIVGMFESDLQVCARLGLEDRILSRASEYFNQSCQAVFAATPALTGHHGDYGPHNVFHSPESVMVIDFEGFRTGFSGEDLADFLVIIDLLPFYHASAPLRRRLRRAFLDGYERQCPFEIESISLFELQALVKRMAHNPRLAPSATVQFGWKRERLLRSYHRYFESLLL